MPTAAARTSRVRALGDDHLASVAAPVTPVPPDTRCAVVYDRFRADAELIAIPVVDYDMPVGLVNRHDLTMRLAHDYGRALYAQKPITALMDAAVTASTAPYTIARRSGSVSRRTARTSTHTSATPARRRLRRRAAGTAAERLIATSVIEAIRTAATERRVSRT